MIRILNTKILAKITLDKIKDTRFELSWSDERRSIYVLRVSKWFYLYVHFLNNEFDFCGVACEFYDKYDDLNEESTDFEIENIEDLNTIIKSFTGKELTLKQNLIP